MGASPGPLVVRRQRRADGCGLHGHLLDLVCVRGAEGLGWDHHRMGDSSYGGSGAPTDAGYGLIGAFAALKGSDGSITAWGHCRTAAAARRRMRSTAIFSTSQAFAALKARCITAWGASSYGGSGAPTDGGYTAIFSTDLAFAALKGSDGTITAWGHGSWAACSRRRMADTRPSSRLVAFAALKGSDGSITAWGGLSYGGRGADGCGHTAIFSTDYAFAALKGRGWEHHRMGRLVGRRQRRADGRVHSSRRNLQHQGMPPPPPPPGSSTSPATRVPPLAPAPSAPPPPSGRRSACPSARTVRSTTSTPSAAACRRVGRRGPHRPSRVERRHPATRRRQPQPRQLLRRHQRRRRRHERPLPVLLRRAGASADAATAPRHTAFIGSARQRVDRRRAPERAHGRA